MAQCCARMRAQKWRPVGPLCGYRSKYEILSPSDSPGGKTSVALTYLIPQNVLRRRAAPALLIQKPEFQTILVSVRSSVKICVDGKSGQNTQNMCAGQTWNLQR